MPYVTLPQSPVFQQVSLEEILSGYVDPSRFVPLRNAPSGTRTAFRRELPRNFVERYDITGMVVALRDFNSKYADLFTVERRSLYHHFEIDKKGIDPRTGRHKKRPIDAPCDELKLALYELKDILENKCGALYHTNAFAYIQKRCAVDSVRRHQANKSHWFLKTDFTNFFSNTTEEFVQHILHMVFPFSEIYKYPAGEDALNKALSLCFLNGGLPQGTPISPMLTNLVMIPIDHRLANCLRDLNGHHYVYTRYADDILISSKVHFNHTNLVSYINSVLAEFQAPFAINPDKTRYGSGNGHNFNLGVCLNEKNQITIGYKRKNEFRGMLHNYILARKNGVRWDCREVAVMDGLLSYYRSIEPNYWDDIVERYNRKYSINLRRMIRDDKA